ncbi:MAG: hypothetical protein ACKV0T_16470 [Planctomycetales bacterium]
MFDDPPRKNVLLLSCMDQRLLDDTVRFMNSLNLHNRYDQVALAGGAMGALQLPDPDLPAPKRWQGVFELHLDKAINVLHRPIGDVFLLDHLDCGAYKYLHPDPQVQDKYRAANLDEMVSLHQIELKNFARKVRQFIECQRQLAENEVNEVHSACVERKSDKGHKDQKQCWDYVSELAQKNVKDWSNIRVSYFVMDLLGKVRQLDLPKGASDTLPNQLCTLKLTM